jgi:hypothetical protein
MEIATGSKQLLPVINLFVHTPALQSTAKSQCCDPSENANMTTACEVKHTAACLAAMQH